jgi:hypothetical protein
MNWKPQDSLKRFGRDVCSMVQAFKSSRFHVERADSNGLNHLNVLNGLNPVWWLNLELLNSFNE